MAATEPSGCDRILATELALAFKSSKSQLLAHRQDVSPFSDFFTEIAELHLHCGALTYRHMRIHFVPSTVRHPVR